MPISVEEFLDSKLEVQKKDLDNLIRRLSLKQKKVKDSFKIGDIKGLAEAVGGLLDEVPLSSEVFRYVKAKGEEYNITSYLEEGFDSNFRNVMTSEGITVRGEFPNYEIFPFMVKISPQDGQALVNKRKVKGLRLKILANIIKVERDKFFKTPFKSSEFLKDLAGAYDSIMEKKSLKSGNKDLQPQSIPIMDIYKKLTPMMRWRREYTAQLFGFHVYRLLKEEAENPMSTTIEGEDGQRKCTFGSVPIGSKSGITVVEENGRETTFGSIKFIKK